MLLIDTYKIGWTYGPQYRQPWACGLCKADQSKLGVPVIGETWSFGVFYKPHTNSAIENRVKLGSWRGYRLRSEAQASLINFQRRLDNGWRPAKVPKDGCMKVSDSSIIYNQNHKMEQL